MPIQTGGDNGISGPNQPSYPLGILQGFMPFSEENPTVARFYNWIVATCVQSSEASIDAFYGVAALTPQLVINLTNDMIKRGEASWGGFSNWVSASAQMARLGIPNMAYGPGGNPVGDMGQKLRNALSKGIPVLLGVGNANNLVDVVTGTHPDAGVHGHALDIVGMADPNTFIADDPNSPQAARGGFVEYTLQNLLQSGADSLVIPNVAPAGSGLAPISTVGLPGEAGTGTTLSDTTPGLSLPGWDYFVNVFKGLAAWNNPGRITKVLAGICFVVFGLLLAIQNEAKAVVVGGLQTAGTLAATTA